MATYPETNAGYLAASNAARADVATLNAALVAAGANPLTYDQFVTLYNDKILTTGGIGAYVAPYPWAGAGTPTQQAAINAAWSALVGDYQDALGIGQRLYGSGINFLSILPLFFVAGLGGAVGAAAGSGAAAAGGGGAVASGGATASVGPALESVGNLTANEAAAAATTASSLSSISNALAAQNGAAGTLANIASTVGGAVSSLTGSTTVGGILSDIINGVGGAVADISKFISPVTSLIGDVLNGIKELDTNIIAPLANTISSDYTTISGLISEVHALANSGIQGILAIPQTLANAFTSLDAANQRLATLTGKINQGIAADTLVPGIGDKIASPLTNIHDVINSAFNTEVPGVASLNLETLSEANLPTFDARQTQQQIIDQWSKGGLLERFGAGVILIFKQLLEFAGFLESFASFAAQAGRIAQPITPLNPNEAADAWWRGQLSKEQAQYEMLRHGLDATRSQLLHDLKAWIPDAPDAIRMFYQGILTSDQVKAILAKRGMSEQDVLALVDAAPERVDPREAIELDGRLAAAAGGFLPSSLGSTVPDAYKLLYPPFMKDAQRAPLDWAAHWRIEGIHWWVTAFFRGLVSREDVERAGQFHNVPAEMLPNLIEVDSEVIQLWMIPDMLATGILTEAEALTYMGYIGMDPKSAAIIVKYGLAKQKVLPAVDVQQYSKLSLGASADMYKTGLVNREVYISILLAHGYSEAAAVLEADYQDQSISLAARKAFAAGLIKQVLAGGITQAQMDQSLASEQFTPAEVKAYDTELQGKLDAKSKLPSTAEIKDMIGASIITAEQGLQLLELDGYSPFIAQAFLQLWFGGTNLAPNTGSTSASTA